jgi:catechol 2,3-dioxygenase-like lactoylglutathione lyase family enzyme
VESVFASWHDWRVRAACLLFVTGCGRLGFDLDPTISDSDAAACTLGPWGAPRLVTELSSSGRDAGAVLTADGLTIIFQSDRLGDLDLYWASRLDRMSPFGAVTPIPNLNTGSSEIDAGWALGESRLYFGSGRLGSTQVFVADRTGNTFTSPVLVDLMSSYANGVFVRDDDLELWFTDGADVLRAVRPTPQVPWQRIGVVAELDSAAADGYPTLTPDGLTVVFETSRDGNADVYEATRASLQSPFSAPSPVSVVNLAGAEDGDPFITADGRELFLVSNRGASADLYVATRDCL